MLFGDAISRTALICWEVDDYSHGLLLPLISAYFLWEKRDDLVVALSASKTSNFNLFFYFPLLCVGLVVLFFGEVSKLLFLSWFAVFPSIVGVLGMIFGAAAAKIVSAPLLLMFMAKPIPDALVPKLFFPLQVLAAKLSAWALEVLQVPVYVAGNVIEIPGMRLMVEEACSGMRSVLALVTVAVIVLYSVSLPKWAKALVAILSVVVAIALNMVRVCATGILAHFVDKRAAEGFFHEFSGLVTFIIGLCVLYGIGVFLEKVTNRSEGKR